MYITITTIDRYEKMYNFLSFFYWSPPLILNFKYYLFSIQMVSH